MPNIPKPDICIIGAGPAGLTAALVLGNKGIPCLLIDKNQFPRDKICGDGLGGKVLSTLDKINPDYPKELEKCSFATGSHGVRFFSPNGKMMELSFNQDNPSHAPGYVCKRRDFDHFLLEKALANPAVRFTGGMYVNQVTRQDDKVILRDTNGNTLAETRLLLFAAGNDKAMLHQLSAPDESPVEEGIGVRGYFENVSGSDQNHSIEIHFLKELLPWYLWIFPFSNGSANAGLALPESDARKSKQSLKELFFYLIEKYPHLKPRFANAELVGKIEANRLPYYNHPVKVAGDNYMLLGDAARLIDPFTGEGIGNAMVSGYTAAEIASGCLASGDFSANVTARYQQEVYRKLGPELELGLRLQKLARNRRLLNLVIGRASRDEKLRGKISEMLYSEQAKSQLKNPMFYLKLLSGL